MDIETITTPERWQALEPEWDALVERADHASVFLTWEWLWPWWSHYRGPSDSLYLLAAREGDRLVGLAPLYRSSVPAYGLGSLRRVGFIGDTSGDSEYLDFIVESGREAEVVRAFLDHLEADSAGWDLAELRLLRKSSPTVDLLRSRAAERHYLIKTHDLPCLSIALPADWDDYLKTLKSRFRSKLRSLLRRLPAEHGAVFERCTSAEELPERLESLFQLHQERWRAEGEPGSFASEARRGFYQDMARGLLERGWLRFYSLRLEDRLVAHEYSFEHRGHVYYLQQGYDVAFKKLNVGTALKAHVIRECLGDGAMEYDFLGGDEAHKKQWGAQTTWCTHVTLARPGLRTCLHVWLPRFAEQVRNQGRALTPDRVLRLKRGIQERMRQKRARSLPHDVSSN